MQMHAHPEPPGNIVRGVRLGTGAMIREGDLYNSSGGRWERAGSSWTGAVIQLGCETVWVRECELSKPNEELIARLVRNHEYITRWGGIWRRIPSPRAKEDGRINWPLPAGASLAELLELGLVAPLLDDQTVFEPTPEGIKYFLDSISH